MNPETETRIAQLMADFARLSHQVVDLQSERDGLVAQVEAFKIRYIRCLRSKSASKIEIREDNLKD